MEQQAIVARVEGEQAYVEIDGEGGGCGHCHEAGGCQSGILNQLFRPAQHRQFMIRNTINAVPGELVVVRIAEGAALRAALLVYAVPVLLLLGGAFAGTALAEVGHEDGGALWGSLVGLIAAGLSGYAVRRGPTGWAMQPLLARKGSSPCTMKEMCR